MNYQLLDIPFGDEPIDDYYVASCPACGDPIDYCQGHGRIGDPYGYSILLAHDQDVHVRCNPMGCDYASNRPLWANGARLGR